jgi:flagellar protein FlaG
LKISGVSSSLNLWPPRTETAAVSLERNPIEVAHRLPSRAQEGNKTLPAPPEDITVSDLQQVIDDTNKMLQYVNERLEFLVHEATNRIMVKVLDRETEEVLREIPPEQILDLVAKLQELVGILVDKKA